MPTKEDKGNAVAASHSFHRRCLKNRAITVTKQSVSFNVGACMGLLHIVMHLKKG